jgi:hypothetical protein
MRLHVGRPVLGAALPCHVIVFLPAVVQLELLANLGQRVVIAVGSVDGKARAMDLVDGDVHVQVVGVVVHHADSLVVGESERIAYAFFDLRQGLRADFLAGSKAQDQVIGAVGTCPGVKGLRIECLKHAGHQFVGVAVGDAHFPDPLQLVLPVDEVLDQLRELVRGRGRCIHLLGYHGSASGFLTAKDPRAASWNGRCNRRQPPASQSRTTLSSLKSAIIRDAKFVGKSAGFAHEGDFFSSPPGDGGF